MKVKYSGLICCIASLLCVIATVILLCSCTGDSTLLSPGTHSPSVSFLPSHQTEVPKDEPTPTATAVPTPTTTPTPTPDPAAETLRLVNEIIAGMTLEEKAGQLFMVRYPGYEKAKTAVSQYHVGGFTLYEHDFENETKDSVRNKLAEINLLSKTGLFYSVDEEGGKVTRISRYSAFRDEPFEAQSYIYKERGLQGLRDDQTEKAALLLDLGVNINLAPVCDMSYDSSNFIFSRTLGITDPAQVGICISEMVKAASDAGLILSLKHFPGYGDNVDTHKTTAYDNRTLADFEERDLIPFYEGIKAGAEIVMVSHNIMACLDSENPASASPGVISYLRAEMNFSGVIMTDALDMKGITDIYGRDGAAVQALLAGCDLLCTTSYETQIPAIIDGVNSGKIPEALLDDAVRHILLLKYSHEILK